MVWAFALLVFFIFIFFVSLCHFWGKSFELRQGKILWNQPEFLNLILKLFRKRDRETDVISSLISVFLCVYHYLYIVIKVVLICPSHCSRLPKFNPWLLIPETGSLNKITHTMLNTYRRKNITVYSVSTQCCCCCFSIWIPSRWPSG